MYRIRKTEVKQPTVITRRKLSDQRRAAHLALTPVLPEREQAPLPWRFFFLSLLLPLPMFIDTARRPHSANTFHWG